MLVPVERAAGYARAVRRHQALIGIAAGTAALLVIAIAWPLDEQGRTAANDCVSETGTGGICQDGTALGNSLGVAGSADGESVYVAADVSDAVAVFDRDQATGALTQKAGAAGCISETRAGGTCQDGTAINAPNGLAASADGKSVYVASIGSDAVAIFDRNPASGALTQKEGTAGCISETGTGGACRDGEALDGALDVAVSADGKSVYVASQLSDAVAVFDRDPATGELRQKAGTAGCSSDNGLCSEGKGLDGALSVAVSADGESLYVASTNSDAVAIFDRDLASGALSQKAGTAGCISETGTGGACRDGKALDGAAGVAVSVDGKSVYVASRLSDAVAVFDRDTATGAITQKAGSSGCSSETGTNGACQDGRALDGAIGVAVNIDGSGVYAASSESSAVAILDRDPDTGALAQNSGAAGCVSETGLGRCQDGAALNFARDLAPSADGRNVYVASAASDAVAILERPVRPRTGA
jgi:DNA-binding beta-propeller fold protein YncE